MPDESLSRTQRLFLRPNLGGVVVGVAFWWRSLEPLLLPRSWTAQALVGAICLAVGYLIGTMLGSLGHRVLARIDRRPSEHTRRRVWLVVIGIAAIVVIAGLIVWPSWQNDHRALIGLDDIARTVVVPMVIVTALVAAILILLGRAVWMLIRWIERGAARLLPAAASVAVTVVIVLVVGNWLLTGVIGPRLHDWANSVYGALEDDTNPDVTQPTSPSVSGSPDSLVRWEDLGREGRNFVAGATTADQLREFHGARWDETEPVRTYVGLRSGDDAEARAALAVEDLERAGGLDRDVVVVWTVTGTGWVDPDAARALEMLHAGNTAIVAQQYSYLPSWISTLVDGPVAREAGSALFDAVANRIDELPEADRPTLLVFGLSLGSYGGEAPFIGIDARSSVANMLARTDGAMFVGPTNANSILTQLTDERDEGSPAWRPVFDGETSVRFANQADELPGTADPNWSPPRVLYLQHPSDPVTFWNMPTMWSQPEWLDGPVGVGVSPRASWFPFVTWAQLVADLAAGFGADPGFGHDYTDAYVAAWATLSPPDGWTASDTGSLETFLDVPR